jgi:hypothetical protein
LTLFFPHVLSTWLETVNNSKIAAQALAELEMAGGRPEQAGWLDWDDLREGWN